MDSKVTDKDGLLKLEERICFALYSTSRKLTKFYAKLLTDMGITYPQFLALAVLWREDGLSVLEIAKQLELEGATTTPLIQRMEKLELVTRKRSFKDERQVHVFLTEKGRSLYHKAAKIPAKLDLAMDLDEERSRRLLEDLQYLKAAIQRHI